MQTRLIHFKWKKLLNLISWQLNCFNWHYIKLNQRCLLFIMYFMMQRANRILIVVFLFYFLFTLIKINQLNDSHAQLMVHWLGEGTNVMLCLAREPPPGPNEDVKSIAIPSSVYISFNNGNTFDDKTYLFQINDTETGKLINSTLDQFSTHPTYNTVSCGVIHFKLNQFTPNLICQNESYDALA